MTVQHTSTMSTHTLTSMPNEEVFIMFFFYKCMGSRVHVELPNTTRQSSLVRDWKKSKILPTYA